MSNVADYAEARAARGGSDLMDLDLDLAEGVGEEMAAALARVEADEEPAAAPAEWGDHLVSKVAELAAPLPANSPMEAQWLRFRDQFAEAMAGGYFTIDQLEREISTGDAYFWPGKNAAVVAKRVVYPSGDVVMQTQWAVGDLEEVLALAPGIEAAARLVGCTSMIVEGRKGWERILAKHGYEPWSVTVRKEL